MSGWWLVLACIVAGMALRGRGLSPEASSGLNRYVIAVAIPALALRTVPDIEADPRLLLACAGPWLVFAGAASLWAILGPRWGLDRPTIGCLILVTGLGNTAFVGYPIVQSSYGDAGMSRAVLVDQLGSFLVFSTLGASVARRYGGGASGSWWAILRFPPFVAFGIGLLALLLEPLARGLKQLDPVLAPISSSLVPVALVALGTRVPLALPPLSPVFVGGLTYKMLLAPALVAAGWWLLAPEALGGLTAKISILQCAMPPMVTAAILAQDNELRPELAAQLVGFGLPVALLSTTLMIHLLG
ncbi:MAG: AEC family transporter [Myxococcota bacterium]